jgi:hypothetical protein
VDNVVQSICEASLDSSMSTFIELDEALGSVIC